MKLKSVKPETTAAGIQRSGFGKRHAMNVAAARIATCRIAIAKCRAGLFRCRSFSPSCGISRARRARSSALCRAQ